MLSRIASRMIFLELYEIHNIGNSSDSYALSLTDMIFHSIIEET